MKAKYISMGLFIALLLGSIGNTNVHSQDNGRRISINSIETSEFGDALLFESYFQIIDSSNQVMVSSDLQEVAVSIGDTEYIADAQQPQTPLYVVLLIDSGTTSETLAEVKEAAQDAVDSAPEYAQFSVLAIGASVNYIQQGFSSNKEIIKSAINSINNRSSGTCLIEGLDRSLNVLNGRPVGRRAIVIITDGAEPGQCSGVDLTSILPKATQVNNATPIYSVSIQNQETTMFELEPIAIETGAYTNSVTLENISDSLDYLMEVLSSQWFIRTAIYPPQGDNQPVRLTPIFSGGIRGGFADKTVSVSRTFNTPKELQINISAFAYDARLDVFNVNLTSNDPTIIVNGSYTIRDAGGLDVLQGTFTDVNQTLSIDASGLTPGEDYTVFIQVQDGDRQSLIDEPLEREFIYPAAGEEPVFPVDIEILRVIPTVDGRSLEVYYLITGAEQIRTLEYSVRDSNQIDVAGVGGQTSAVNTSFLIPLDFLNKGEDYEVIIRAFGANNESLLDEPALYEFTDPRPQVELQMRISSIEYDKKEDILKLKLVHSNVEAVKNLEIVLEADGISNERTVLFEQGISQTIRIPTDGLERGKDYTISVMPVDSEENDLLEQPLEDSFVYPVENISFITRIGRFVGNPIVLGILLAGFIIGIVFYALNRRNKDSGEDDFRHMPNPRKNETILDLRRNQYTPPPPREDYYDPPPSYRSNKSNLETELRRDISDETIRQPIVPYYQETEVLVARDDTIPEIAPAFIWVAQSRTYANRGGNERKFRVKRFFIIGRKFSDLTLSADQFVSGEHLRITFSLADKAYKATVLSSQANATRINDRVLNQGEEIILLSDQKSIIELGNISSEAHRVVLEFTVQDFE